LNRFNPSELVLDYDAAAKLFPPSLGSIRGAEFDEQVLDRMDLDASLGRLCASGFLLAACAVALFEFRLTRAHDRGRLAGRASHDSSTKIDVEVVFRVTPLVSSDPWS
jgi:hypothetical protein